MTYFLLHLAITALSLGAASRIVPGVRFQSWGDLLVAALVRGFELPGFWSAFFTGIIVSVLSIFLHAVFDRDVPVLVPMPQQATSGTWT